MKKILSSILLSLLLCIIAVITAPTMYEVKAATTVTASEVTIGTIDYDNLTMIVKTNGNDIVYMSLDKTSWNEIEGTKVSDNLVMDISWISSSDNKTIYLKGNKVTTVVSVTLPAKDTSIKVTYNKADHDFTFTNCDAADNFQWRKSSDYTWYTVSLNTDSTSYKSFLTTIDSLLVKGAKIIIRIPQTLGKSAAEPGTRPSKEVTITLVKRNNAPTVSVNASKLTLNTTTKLEYFSSAKADWVSCDKSMTIESIAPAALYKNGANDVTLMLRVAATSSKSYSKTQYLTVTGQSKAPTIGGKTSDVSYYYENNRLCMTFNKASKTDVYSYTIVKPGTTFDAATASWKLVKNTTVRKFTNTSVPDGSLIYVRKQGTNANVNKNIVLVLSSETANYKVTFPTAK